MYKVFFNDRTVILTDDFAKNFQVRYGLFYKYKDVEDLRELIEFYSKLQLIRSLFIFSDDLDKLQDAFRSCFTPVNAAGGFVRNTKNEILMIFRRGKWDLPKGKLNKNEDFKQAALREVEEECGIHNIKIERPLLSTYHTYTMNGRPVLKKTFWFDMYYAGDEPPEPQTEEDITDIGWFTKDRIPTLLENTYGAILDVFRYTAIANLT